ncbi:lipoate--protein ligase family protein [Ammoniphilus sp. CFH 90114]|uniref:lipoate--protein ligase family protein n=1 Tax=Ammoniphilus sp. CFH 90114 TaxID=2493665 RepID=UPI00100F286E|nr:lipoate--protein ligase family protein [Ammoniphilus sp. CFH 90114]RXT07849.1 lipoate--protein ligase family protein [Ammoniphilus sp. CFH 90114]
MSQATLLPAQFNIVDSTVDVMKGDILYPFALDELCARKVGEGTLGPLVHLWRHQKAFVMGLRDRKLPYSDQAMEWLERQGYAVTVRNSGGAAVPLDPGVVNLSIILPNPTSKIDFHQDFELMYQIIRDSLGSFVEKGEIVGSYCPGDFDLSVKGKKFCGIAQRRQTKAFVVQAFIVVEGKGDERAELVRRFYEIASGGEEKGNYPLVSVDRMASLQELVDVGSVVTYVEGLKGVLSNYGGVAAPGDGLSLFMPEMERTIVELRNRYEKRS